MRDISVYVMLDYCPSDEQAPSPAEQNTFGFEPLIESLLSAPISLSTINIGLSFFSSQQQPDLALGLTDRWSPTAIPILHALNWSLLDQVMRSHPDLKEINVEFAQMATSDPGSQSYHGDYGEDVC